MSSTADGYRDGVALWAAATDRARTEAVARGANSGALLRQFVNDRFLARVFHAPDAPWSSKVAPPSSRAWTTPVRPRTWTSSESSTTSTSPWGASDPQPRSTSATTSGSSSPATTGPSLVQVNPTWTGTACTWTRTAAVSYTHLTLPTIYS